MAKKNVSVSYKVVNHDSAESEEETQSDSPPSENLIMDNSSYRRKASAKRVTSGSSVAVITDVFADFNICSPKWIGIIIGVVILVGAFIGGVLYLTGVFSGDTESESDTMSTSSVNYATLCETAEGISAAARPIYKNSANQVECDKVYDECDTMDDEERKATEKCTWTMRVADEPAAEPAADGARTDEPSTHEEAE